MIAPARCTSPVDWRIRRPADRYAMTLREAGRYLRAFLVAMLLLAPQLAPQAAGTDPAAKQQDAMPSKVHELLDILADPGVQTWVARQRAGASAEPARASEEGTIADHLAGRLAAIRAHMA